MARPLRIEFPGATYHVTSRGNRQGPIVLDDADRAAWTRLLGDVVVRRQWELFAFALMDNHFHLFVRTPHGDLSDGMQHFLSAYASRFGRRHRLRGHVFQGRFDSPLVEGETYFWNVARYVVLNPVRAGMVPRPQDWRWSSYADLVSPTPRLAWVAHRALLSAWDGAFGGTDPLTAYRKFVEDVDALDVPSPFLGAHDGWILGGNAFVERVRGMLGTRLIQPEVPREIALRARALSDVEQAVHRRLGSSATTLGNARGGRAARRVFAAVARRLTVATHAQIARRLGMSRPQSAANLAARAVVDTRLTETIERVVADLLDLLGSDLLFPHFPPANRGKRRSDPA